MTRPCGIEGNGTSASDSTNPGANDRRGGVQGARVDSHRRLVPVYAFTGNGGGTTTARSLVSGRKWSSTETMWSGCASHSPEPSHQHTQPNGHAGRERSIRARASPQRPPLPPHLHGTFNGEEDSPE